MQYLWILIIYSCFVKARNFAKAFTRKIWMMVFLVEYFNGYAQLSQWDLTFLEQRFVTTYLIWINFLPKSTRKELTGQTLVMGKLWHVWRERTLGGGATSVSKSSFLSVKQALLFPADVLSLPCSSAKKMFCLVRSQGKEIYCSKNIYAYAI